jgi:predicted nucleic acid-binding protein
VILFLDSSVLLAAAGSSKGASRLLILHAADEGWRLLTSDYCEGETQHNLPKLGAGAEDAWRSVIRPRLVIVPSCLVLDRPLACRAVKDRPVVIAALRHGADYLLTLDRDDFQDLLGKQVYGLNISTPGDFLRACR